VAELTLICLLVRVLVLTLVCILAMRQERLRRRCGPVRYRPYRPPEKEQALSTASLRELLGDLGPGTPVCFDGEGGFKLNRQEKAP
jgi:hypothetical protein